MPKADAPTVVRLLREYAQRAALRGGNPYRSRAYARAADALAALPGSLERYIQEDRLQEVPGVGNAISDIVTKLYQTGTHPSLESMRRDVPAGVLELLSVPGLKPEKALKLYSLLGVDSLPALEKAARDDRIKATKGLGASLQH